MDAAGVIVNSNSLFCPGVNLDISSINNVILDSGIPCLVASMICCCLLDNFGASLDGGSGGSGGGGSGVVSVSSLDGGSGGGGGGGTDTTLPVCSTTLVLPVVVSILPLDGGGGGGGGTDTTLPVCSTTLVLPCFLAAVSLAACTVAFLSFAACPFGYVCHLLNARVALRTKKRRYNGLLSLWSALMAVRRLSAVAIRRV